MQEISEAIEKRPIAKLRILAALVMVLGILLVPIIFFGPNDLGLLVAFFVSMAVIPSILGYWLPRNVFWCKSCGGRVVYYNAWPPERFICTGCGTNHLVHR